MLLLVYETTNARIGPLQRNSLSKTLQRARETMLMLIHITSHTCFKTPLMEWREIGFIFLEKYWYNSVLNKLNSIVLPVRSMKIYDPEICFFGSKKALFYKCYIVFFYLLVDMNASIIYVFCIYFHIYGD